MSPQRPPGPRRLRSVLFAPAVRPDLVAKLPRAGADLVVIDCEDASPPGAKDEARAHAAEAGPRLAAAGETVAVRVNDPSTPWFADDVRSALGPHLAAVVVPKLDHPDAVDRVAAALDAAGLDELGIVAGIETVTGVLDARTVLRHPRIVAAYFGAEDHVADLGGRRTSSNHEVATARAWVAMCARVAGVPVCDMIVADFGDTERFRREADEARDLGFAGKLCIHPDQVAVAHEAFTPDPDEVAAARRILAAHAEARRAGRGVAVVDDRMIDEPLAAQARRTLALAGLDPDDADAGGPS
ncbi:MAG: CoA ester lyase [Actinomyces sp.]|nr:MAG: CoA ester lyase [Actinomyces sp.]